MEQLDAFVAGVLRAVRCRNADPAGRLPHHQKQKPQQPMTTQNSFSTDDANNSRNLPPVGHDVRVKHNGRERRAYRDSDGKWRDLHNGNVLQGDVQVLKGEQG